MARGMAITKDPASGRKVCHSTCLQDRKGNLIASGPGFSNGGKTYTSKGGNVFNTKNPPPGRCFNCQGPHWRKDCPYGQRA